MTFEEILNQMQQDSGRTPAMANSTPMTATPSPLNVNPLRPTVPMGDTAVKAKLAKKLGIDQYTPESATINKNLIMKLLSNQQGNIDAYNNQISGMEKGGDDNALKYFAAASDIYGGKAPASNAVAGINPDEKAATIAKLRNLAQDNEQALIKNLIDMGKSGDKNENDVAKMALMLAGKESKSGSHEEEVNDKLAKDLRTDLDADKGRAGNFGQISGKLIAAQRLEALAKDSKGNYINLTPQQMEELGTGLAALIGNGSGAIADSRVKRLVPQSLWGDVMGVKQWVMNDPKGTDQQAFIKNMMDTVGRERITAQKQMNDIQTKRLPAHDLLKRRKPDLYNKIVQGYVDQNNPFMSTEDTTSTPSFDQDAIKAELERRKK